MNRRTILVLAAAAAMAGGAALAEEDVVQPAAPKAVANFTLLDENRAPHELYKLADAKTVVLVTQGNGCPISRSLGPAVKALKARYEPQGVRFLMLNSNLQDGFDAVKEETTEFSYQVPILLDRQQTVGEALGVTRTGEFFVIEPKTWRLAYRGPLDDRLDYGTQKANASHTWLADAIDATLAGRPAAAATKHSPGCLIDFPERAAQAAAHAHH